MAAFLILAHAPLASALKSVAAHTYSECGAHVVALDVMPEMTTDEVDAAARAALELLGGGEVLILADVHGASPCNSAQRVADGTRVRVVAGVNVPMLWRSLCYAAEPLELLVARALEGAVLGVKHIAVSRPQDQATQL